MEQAKKTFEKLFWLLLLASPVLDVINGIWAYILSGGDGYMLSSLNLVTLPSMSPSLTVRMAFLVVMTSYVFLQKQWRSVLMFVTIGGCWVLTVGYEFLRGVSFSLSADIQYIVRFCYCLLVLVCYTILFKKDGRGTEALRSDVDKALTISLLISATGVVLPFLLDMGFYTYADPLGFRGNRGFFYAGNDITAVTMLILPVVLAAWMETEEVKKPCFAWLQAGTCAVSLLSMLLVGTKTAFLGLGVTLASLGVFALINGLWKKNWRAMIRMLTVFLALVLLAVTVNFANLGVRAIRPDQKQVIPYAPPQSTTLFQTITGSATVTEKYQDYLEDKNPEEPEDPDDPENPDDPEQPTEPKPSNPSAAETIIFSGRTGKLRKALGEFKAALPLSAAVGIGRGSQEFIIEMDLIEVVLYYGLLGTVCMLWLYLSQGVKVVIDLFRSFSLRNLAVCVALGLTVGFLFLAGHILFSVTAGYYFAFMIVYARLFCTKDGIKTRIP